MSYNIFKNLVIKITIHFVLYPVNWRWMALSYFLANFFLQDCNAYTAIAMEKFPQ